MHAAHTRLTSQPFRCRTPPSTRMQRTPVFGRVSLLCEGFEYKLTPRRPGEINPAHFLSTCRIYIAEISLGLFGYLSHFMRFFFVGAYITFFWFYIVFLRVYLRTVGNVSVVMFERNMRQLGAADQSRR